MGTPRQTNRKTVRRVCRKQGLLVIVSPGRNVGSCDQYQPRPSDITISRVANSDANYRISHISNPKEDSP
jgi:hypothetical protein